MKMFPILGAFSWAVRGTVPKKMHSEPPSLCCPSLLISRTMGNAIPATFRAFLGERKAPESFQPEAVGTQEDPTSPFA